MDAVVRAVTYARVSTDAQERGGTSLDTQEQECLKWACSGGCEVVESIRDTASGATLERAGMERLRRMVRGGEVDVLVAYAFDRLSRNQNQIGVLLDEADRHGVRIDTVTERLEDSATGRFIVQARAFTAEIEREKMAERTMRGKAETARKGRLPQGTGRGMYGYVLVLGEGRRTVNEEQAEVVRAIFADFAAGSSAMGIANGLNAAGVPTFAGKKWASATVYHLLRNESYTGRSVYRKTKVRAVADPETGKKRRRVEPRAAEDQIEMDGATPRIIDGDTFAMVQVMLDDPERRKRGRPKYEYALSRRIKCARCGAAMVGQTLTHNGYNYRYYRCRRAFAGTKIDRCDSKYVRADKLEPAVLDQIARVLAQPGVILAEAERLRAEQSATVDVESLKQKLANLDEKKTRLGEAYMQGAFTKPQFTSKMEGIQRQRIQVEKELAPALKPMAMPDEKGLLAACAALQHWVANAQAAELRTLLTALQIKVTAEVGVAGIEGVIPSEYPLPASATQDKREGAHFTVPVDLPKSPRG